MSQAITRDDQLCRWTKESASVADEFSLFYYISRNHCVTIGDEGEKKDVKHTRNLINLFFYTGYASQAKLSPPVASEGRTFGQFVGL